MDITIKKVNIYEQIFFFFTLKRNQSFYSFKLTITIIKSHKN